MKSSDELFPLVEFYRQLGNPAFEGSVVEITDVIINDTLFNILNRVWTTIQGQQLKGKVELEFSESPFSMSSLDEEPLMQSIVGKTAQVAITLRKNDPVRFYLTEDDLIENCIATKTLSFPKFYYIVDQDYCHGKDSANKRPNTLRNIDNIFDLLTKLRTFANRVDSSGDFILTTFYVADSDVKDEVVPTDIALTFSMGLKDITLPLFTILDDVVNIELSESHCYEKKVLLKSSICEILKAQPTYDPYKAVDYIVTNWAEIDRTYRRNLETFITGISFSKLKYDVEVHNLAFLDNINAALVDISMKLTALPASFGLWLFIVRADHSILKMWGYLFALALMTLILSFALEGHAVKFSHVKESIKTQLLNLQTRFKESKKDQTIHAEILVSLSSTETLLNKRVKKIGMMLWVYRFSIWLPVAVILSVLLFKYYQLICP